VIADFLLYLFKERNLQPRTIDGYRSALASAFKHSTNKELGKNQELTALIQSFYQERPNPSLEIPGWDIALVLGVLSRPPFEPLAQIPLNLLTWKTTFLLLLASGSRRSEIHALNFKKIEHKEGWKSITLHVIPSFVAKCQLKGKGASAFKPLNIPALSTVVTPEMKEERALCPVRAIKIYLAKTQELRKGKALLLVSYKAGHVKDICKSTVSGWIRKLIVYCYNFTSDNVKEQALPLSNTRTHEIRGLAASLSFKGGRELEAILQAGSWKSHQTFTRFYLKDTSMMDNQLMKLGPLVSAQTVIH